MGCRPMQASLPERVLGPGDEDQAAEPIVVGLLGHDPSGARVGLRGGRLAEVAISGFGVTVAGSLDDGR